MRNLLLIIVVALLTHTGFAQDKLILRTGESYQGEVIRLGKNGIKLRTAHGVLRFKRVEVKKLLLSKGNKVERLVYYSFDGDDEHESKGSQQLINNGATPATDRKGQANSAYQFDGSDDFVQTGVRVEGSFSINLWYDFTENTEADFIGMIDNGHKPKHGWKLYMPNSGNTIRFISYPPRTMCDYQYPKPLIGWHMITLVYDEFDCYLYVDAELKASKTFENVYVPEAAPLTIGYCGSYHTKGRIDDVSIYSGSLLLAEIQKLLRR